MEEQCLPVTYVADVELAQIFDVKPSTLKKWRFQKRGPRWLKLGRCVRYPLQSALDWAESQQGGGYDD